MSWSRQGMTGPGPVCLPEANTLLTDFGRMTLSGQQHYFAAASSHPVMGCATEARQASWSQQNGPQSNNPFFGAPANSQGHCMHQLPQQRSASAVGTPVVTRPECHQLEHAADQHPQSAPQQISQAAQYGQATDGHEDRLMSDEFDEELSYLAGQVRISNSPSIAQSMHYIF